MIKHPHTCLLILAAFALAAITSSCSKSEFIGPTLASDSVNYKRTFTVDPGVAVKLESKFLKPETLSYDWSLDGTALTGGGTSYMFSSNEPGSYIITQKISNSIAQVYIDYYVVVRGGYDNGSFIFTNNAAGAAVSYVSRDLSVTDNDVYKTVNPTKTLGSKITCAKSFYGKTYIVTETEGIVAVNTFSMKEVGRLASLPAKPNDFINVDRQTALLSTDDGVYRVNLNPLSIGDRIPNISGRIGKMVQNSTYTLALTLSNGVIAIKNSTLLLAGVTRVGKSGLAADYSGNVWTSYMDTLYKINSSLYVTKYLVGKNYRVASSWNPWNEGTLTASTYENAIYYVAANGDGTLSRQIVKINLNSLPTNTNISITPFITLPDDRSFSGIGLRLNSENNIIVSTVDNSGGTPQMVVYRGGDASLVGSVAVTATNAKSILTNRTK